MNRLILLYIGISLILTGCMVSAADENTSPPESTVYNQEKIPAESTGSDDPFTKNNLTIVDRISIGTDTGYRAQDANGKPFLILKGSNYNMGYQMGYLMPEGAAWTTKEYPLYVGARTFKIKPEDAPELIAFFANEILTLCHDSIHEIPQYLLDEMQGVADGAAARGFDVTFDDVLLLNQGFDGINAMLLTGRLPSFSGFISRLRDFLNVHPEYDQYVCISGSKILFPDPDFQIAGCNGFVASGNATVNGKVYHGRDFMFHIADKYQDYACMIMYLPDAGNPFATVSAPGFVAHPTCLNSKGLSIGIDTVKAECTRSDIGLSSGLVMRDIINQCSNLDEAMAAIKSINRGVAFIYTFADDEYSETYTNGVILEAGMSAPSFTGPDLMPKWQQFLLSGYIKRLDENPLPDQGIMTRTQSWEYPSAFENTGFIRLSGSPSWFYFQEQMETWPDVVMTTNHFIIPRMVFTTFIPWIHLLEKTRLPDSLWRYAHLFECIEGEYGAIDFETAKELVSFLNPNNRFGGYEKYAPGGPIKGHHALIDNKELVIEALFGYYGPDPEHMAPWARIELKPFLENALP